jgi:hypothetical protein
MKKVIFYYNKLKINILYLFGVKKGARAGLLIIFN